MQEITPENAKTELVTESKLKHIYDVFLYGKNPKTELYGYKIENDVYMYSILRNPLKKTDFIRKLLESMTDFIDNRTWWELYEELITHANTWDCYSLAVIYMNMIDDVFISKPEIYNTYIGSKLNKYVEAMEDVLYSTPRERPSIKHTLAKIESLV